MYADRRAEQRRPEQGPNPALFYTAIDRQDLALSRPDSREALTRRSPLGFFSMETYGHGIKGGGGLGVLAADIIEIAKDLGLPVAAVTHFYPLETRQVINPHTLQQELVTTFVTPEERGYEKIGSVSIKTIGSRGDRVDTPLDVYKRSEGSATVITLCEPNLGSLYQDTNNSDHRLYQIAALGFGGHQALKLADLQPRIYQLNEAPTVFAALARLDELTFKTQSFSQALAEVKATTLYTNHTLVQAAEATFTEEQINKYIMPNIRTPEVERWLRQIIKDARGKLKLSTLTIELAGKANGVSKLHAEQASRQYTDSWGNRLHFEHVTNGIALDRWWQEDLLKLLRVRRILDQFNLPGVGYRECIDDLDQNTLTEIHNAGRKQLRDLLREKRVDQHGEHIDIPEDAKVAYWSRRLAGYKRPELAFDDPEQLAQMLEDENMHFIIAGRAHPTDFGMQEKLTEILQKIDANPRLKARVHFVQDYDEELGRALAQGGDIYLNTPEVIDETTGKRKSTEASGTSGEKAPLVIQISVDDGHYADDEGDLSYLRIEGRNRQEELTSLYDNLRKAAGIIDDPEALANYWKQQLKNNLHKYSGARMMADYINLLFPPKFIN